MLSEQQMQNERINTIPIENFIKQVKSADANREKEIRLDIQQAKNITFTLGLILARLNGRLEDLLAQKQEAADEQTIKITMDGGSGW